MSDRFGKDLKNFVVTMDRDIRSTFADAATEAHESILVGSPVSGSEGTPVDTGVLRDSIHIEFTSPYTARISTNVAYAPAIEEGIGKHGALTLRSSVGGWHAWKRTIAAWDRFVSRARERARAVTK